MAQLISKPISSETCVICEHSIDILAAPTCSTYIISFKLHEVSFIFTIS